jgi:hypothetical protein
VPAATPKPHALTDLIALDTPVRPTFETVTRSLYENRFTGAVLIHFRNGVPKEIELPRPIHVKLGT